jgi:hypothetical protein
MEAVEDVARPHQGGNGMLDDSDDHAIRPREPLAPDGQHSGESARTWAAAWTRCRFVQAPPGGPFGDDPERSRKALPPESSPELGTVAAAGGPLAVEALEDGLERIRSRAERFGAAAADHIAHDLSRAAGAPDDPLDRDAFLEERQHDSIRFCTVPPALVLEPLGRGQDVWIDGTLPQNTANLPHLPAYCGQKGGTGVLEQMPAVRDLKRRRASLDDGSAIAAAAVARNDLHFGPGRQPSRDNRQLAVGQEVTTLRRSRSQISVP